jgi:signal transduction histidine kinase
MERMSDSPRGQEMPPRVATQRTEYQGNAAERKRCEKIALHASALEAVFTAMTDGVFVFDRDGSVLYMNAAFRALLGDDVQGERSLHSLAAWGSIFMPRDEQGRPLSPDEWPGACVLRGETLHGAAAPDLLLRTGDGRDRLFRVSGVPVRDSEGHIAGGVLVCREVTERRRLERRTHEALQALLAMAETLVQAPTHVMESSASGEQVLQAEERHGQSIIYVVGQRLVELTCSVLECQRAGIVALEPETTLQRPVAVVGLLPEHEQRWWADTQGASLRDYLGSALIGRLCAGEPLVLDLMQPPYRDRRSDELYGVRKMLLVPMQVGDQLSGILWLEPHDLRHEYTADEMALVQVIAKLAALVLERERLLREREEARANELALREANRRMDEFLGMVSHELRTPLTTIKANIQVARRQLKGMVRAGSGSIAEQGRAFDRLQGLLERAEHQVERQNRLVSDLVDVSRIQAGRFELRPTFCNLVAIVREVVEEQRLAHPERTILLTLDPAAARVFADADRVAQVVTNYLTNALKYSPADRPVEVTLGVREGMAYLAVRDEGPGLPAEEQQRIWERFHRAQGIEAPGGSAGLGLGLHISRSIIERHQGQVGVQSAPGQGSTFWFTLPLASQG